jgi:predicted ribosomally synthesized peptide with SipW-like signal peptide
VIKLRILKSLVIIGAMAALVVGVTRAYFTSIPVIENNTAATGLLEITIDGGPTAIGANFSPLVPGVPSVSGIYKIKNADPNSTLTAKKLLLSIQNRTGEDVLWNELMIKIEVGRNLADVRNLVYTGKLSTMANPQDLLGGWWTDLIPGATEELQYEVWIPAYGYDQSSLMNKTVSWNFNIEGQTE